jgi:EmrB/QacA subfamily drug resistance transporter
MLKSIVAEQAEADAGPAERTSSHLGALACLSLSMLLSSLGTSIANVALPTLATAFAAPFQSVQWIVLAYLLAVTIMSVGAGRLGDAMGHRRVLAAGLALFAVASLLCAVAPTLSLLIAARALQGLAAAVLMALAVALVAGTVAKARTGSAMGLLGTMSAIGTALGPSLGGVLLGALGWRSIFLINLPLVMAALFLAWRHLPADRRAAEAAPTGFDATGTLLLALALAAYALAMTIGRGRLGTVNAVLLGAAVVCAVCFVLAEARARSPLIPPAAFRDAAFSASLAMNAIVATVMMATLVVGPFYLYRSLGLGAATVGAVMAVGPVVSMLSGIPAGRLVDRFAASRIVIIGLLAMAAGAFALSLTPASSGIAGYIAAIVVLTPGYQLFQAANNTAVMKDVGPERRGVISGMLNLSRNLGLITGASVMGEVFALGSGSSGVATAAPTAVATGMRITFGLAATLLLGGLAIAVASRAPATRVPVKREAR